MVSLAAQPTEDVRPNDSEEQLGQCHLNRDLFHDSKEAPNQRNNEINLGGSAQLLENLFDVHYNKCKDNFIQPRILYFH